MVGKKWRQDMGGTRTGRLQPPVPRQHGQQSTHKTAAAVVAAVLLKYNSYK